MSLFSKRQKELKEQAAQEAIFDAAVKLIADKGGDALTMQEIAASAGIATGTLYNYFKNKVELLYFIDRRLHAIILSRGQAITDDPSLSPTEKLHKIVLEILGFCEEYHGVFDLAEQFGVKERIPRQEKDANIQQAFGFFQSMINDGINQGIFRSVDAASAAEMFFSAVIGVSEIEKWFQEYQTPQQAEKLMTFFLDYLKP
ncbi:MAG: TetR/AcrR family transcriptional regulator [Planctomycetota bacterium]|jgi:AcrR family transcriptional regulator